MPASIAFDFLVCVLFLASFPQDLSHDEVPGGMSTN